MYQITTTQKTLISPALGQAVIAILEVTLDQYADHFTECL